MTAHENIVSYSQKSKAKFAPSKIKKEGVKQGVEKTTGRRSAMAECLVSVPDTTQVITKLNVLLSIKSITTAIV